MTPSLSRKKPPICLDISMHIDERFGGVATSLPRFSQAVTQTGRFHSRLVAFCDEDETCPASIDADAVRRVPSGRLRWATDSRLRGELEDLIRESAIVHIHGLWEEHSFIAARLCRRVGRPYVVSAHGMLEPWALRNKAMKKFLYSSLIERNNLAHAACLRALTSAELGHYREYGVRAPVAVIPNGVTIPEGVNAEPFWHSYPALRGSKMVLFLGRIHYKKGVHVLCQAFADTCRRCPEAKLVIAGPDSEDTLGGVQELVRELGIPDRVIFTGMIEGELKWAAMKAASVFALPSFSEGFSIAVLEALGCGIPVIISEACYFPEVAQRRCGWIASPERKKLSCALSEFVDSSSAETAAMGERGKQLVESRYSWFVAAGRISDLLGWVIGEGRPQSFVFG